MNLTDTINKIDKINALIDKLETKQMQVQDDLLDWIYAERKEVLDYHNTSRYADLFAERDTKYISLSARLGSNEVVIVATEQYGDAGNTETLCIPINHLLNPALVANLIAANKARKAAQDVEAKTVQELNEKKLLADLKAKYEPKS